MKTSRKLVQIGISAIAALLLLVFGINYLKGVNLFDSSNDYFAVYEDVTGLAVSAPVTANGFKVGQVSDIKYLYDDPGHVKVEMALDGELRIPEGTVAELGSDLLGTATITLKMPKEVKSYLPEGATIQSTKAGGLMDNVSTELLPGIVNMIPKIDSMLVVVTDLVGDPALAASLKRLDEITTNLNTMSANIAQATKPLPGVVNSASQIASNLNSMSANLDSISRELQTLPLNETMANVKAVTDNLLEVTNQLKRNDSSLGMLLNDPELYNSLNRAVASLDSLISDVKAQPKRYLKFSVF